MAKKKVKFDYSIENLVKEFEEAAIETELDEPASFNFPRAMKAICEELILLREWYNEINVD